MLRTLDDPEYRWDTLLVVTDTRAIGDARRWTARSADAFADAAWLTVALARAPEVTRAWRSLGLDVRVDEVLTSRALPA